MDREELVIEGPQAPERKGRLSRFQIFYITFSVLFPVFLFALLVVNRDRFFQIGPGYGEGLLEFVRLTSPERAFGGKSSVTLLLVGVDNVENSSRSDTIILCSIDFEDYATRVLSLPRDTEVDLGKYGLTKINHAFTYGGIDLLREKVEGLFGIPVDYYLVIDYAAFINVVDELGGLDIDVKQRMYYRDRSQNLLIDLQPGPQHLNGQNVLDYARFRHDRTGDYGRMRRQQEVLSLILDKMKSPLNLLKAPSLVDHILKNQTNLTAPQLFTLKKVADRFKVENLQGKMLEGRSVTRNGIFYLELTPDEIESARRFLMGEEILSPGPTEAEDES